MPGSSDLRVGMNAYIAVLRIDGVLRVTASQLLARLPLGMLSLAVLLHVHAVSDSYALAGAVVAIMTLGEAVAMPMTARLLGRAEPRRLLLTLASLHAGGLCAIAAVGAGPWALGVAAIFAGATVPPIMPAVRALYPKLVQQPHGVRTLFALDTTAQELIWIVGPVAATLLAASGSTGLGLVVAATLTLVGTVAFVLSPRLHHLDSVAAGGTLGRVLRHRSVTVAMLSSAALMGSFTALEVGIVAEHEHDPMVAGAVIAVPSVASLIGGLWFGHRRFDLRRLSAALAAVAVGTAAAGFASQPAVALVFLFISGLGFAPALAALYYMVSNSVDDRIAAEAFGWLQTAALGGAAGGTALAGVSGEATGPVGAYVAATMLGAVAAATPMVFRLSGPLAGLAGPGVRPSRTHSGAEEQGRQPVEPGT